MDLGGFSVFVSGFPRSGTSLLMRMLHKGGVDILWDEDDPATSGRTKYDPYGVYEFKLVGKAIKEHPAEWSANAAIKLVSIYIKDWLPDDGRPIKVIFMTRDPNEIITSLLAKRLLIEADIPKVTREALSILRQREIETLILQYKEVIKYPRTAARQIADFLGVELDIEAMASAIERKDSREERRKEAGIIRCDSEDYLTSPIELAVNVNYEDYLKLQEEGKINVSGHSTESGPEIHEGSEAVRP